MIRKNTLANSAIIIVLFNLIGKVTGLIREMLMASRFGSSVESDSFFVAMSASGILTSLLANALSTTLVPIFIEIKEKERIKFKVRFLNNMINVAIFISLILILLTWFIAPILVNLFAKGFTGEQFGLAVKLTRIGLARVLFSSVSGILTGYLHSEQRFFSASLILIPGNLIYICYLFWFSSEFGISGVMFAVVIGTAAQILVQLPGIKQTGFTYQNIFNLNDKYLKKVIKLSRPILFGVALNDLSLILDKTLASDLVVGSISSLNYANIINSTVETVFIVTITTIIYPMLSTESSKKNIDGLKSIFNKGIRIILLITIPATMGIIVLARPLVSFLLERGAFSETETIMTSQALTYYAIGIVFSSIRLIIIRVFYSLQDTKTPVYNSVIALVVDIILNIILVKYMAHSGLALATSISSIVAAVLLYKSLFNKIGSLNTMNLVIFTVKIIISTILTGLIVNITYNRLEQLYNDTAVYTFIILSITILVGIFAYIILCLIFQIKEIKLYIVNFFYFILK